jgi:NAD dependent epimerase/dehydratase family enzyme
MSPGKERGRETNVRIGILGTGVVGKTIAARLDGMGHEVVVGTRNPEKTLSRTEPDQYGNPTPSAPGNRSTRKCSWVRLAKLLPTVR